MLQETELKNYRHVIENWDRIYSENLKANHKDMKEPHLQPLADQDEHSFGYFEKFRQKRVGPYEIIFNETYALRGLNQNVNRAQREKRINLVDKNLKFSGWPTVADTLIVVYIDLEKNALVWAEEKRATPNFIFLKMFQFCKGHSLLILDADKNDPQILTEPYIEKLLKVNGLLPNCTFGYNGQGAGSTFNIFHFQMIQTGFLSEMKPFHFQTIKGEELTTVAIPSKDKDLRINISMFDYVGAIFVKFSSPTVPLSDPAIIKEATKMIFKVIELTFKENRHIPHNINFPDQHNLYLVLRNFATPTTRYGWIEYSGVYRADTLQQFEEADEKKIQTLFQNLSFKKEQKDQIKSELKALFSS